MIFLIIVLCMSMMFIIFCAIRMGDERRYLDEHYVALRVYRYYKQEKFKIIAEWPTEGAARCVTLHVYSRQEDPGTGKPQVEFLPQAILRTNKETGEVYDWYEVY